ncbi:MAG: lysostaphin resistance A-like protein [Nocardioides sp.]
MADEHLPGAPPAGSRSRAELCYAEVHHAGKPGWWRPLVGVVALAVTTYVVAPLVAQVGRAGWFALRGEPVGAGLERVLDLAHPTPAGLAMVNLVLASGILVVWALARWLHGLRPRSVSSVGGGLRWRLLARCLGLAVVALVAMVVVSGVLSATAPPDGVTSGAASGAGAAAELNAFTTTTRDFALVVLFLTPLQAAGEEYVFRGYLTQAFGGLFAGRLGSAVAVGVPAVLFALAHGLGQSPPVFVDRLVFGIVAGILVLRTGGLEAGIAMHVLNNWLAFGFALAFGDMAGTLTPGAGRWLDLVPTLVQAVAYLGLVSTVARRHQWRRCADGSELVASSPRVYRFPPAQPPTGGR